MLSDKALRALRNVADGEFAIGLNMLHYLENLGFIEPAESGAQITSDGLAYLRDRADYDKARDEAAAEDAHDERRELARSEEE